MTYVKSNVPLPYSDDVKTKQLNVIVGFNLFEIDEIDTKKLEFKMAFQVTLKWHEYRILHYINLKENYPENVLPPSLAKDLWIPPLEFTNTITRAVIEFDAKAGASLKVIRNDTNSSGKQDEFLGPKELHEGKRYTAEDNMLYLITNQRLTFKCTYDLTYYPFDHQKCIVEVRSTT